MDNRTSQNLRLRRLPSYLSFATATNSTMSGIPGPGRFVGELIRSGGRRLENGLGRVATRMGFGPNAAVLGFLVEIGEIHDRSGCETKLKIADLEPSFPVLLEAILSIRGRCADCRRYLMLNREITRRPGTNVAATLLSSLR